MLGILRFWGLKESGIQDVGLRDCGLSVQKHWVEGLGT